MLNQRGIGHEPPCADEGVFVRGGRSLGQGLITRTMLDDF